MFKRMVASMAIIALLSSSLLAQAGTGLPESPAQNAQAFQSIEAEYSSPLKQYTQPYSMRGIWKPYAAHGLPEPGMRNSDRLHSLLKNGKLMLSLNDAVALAMENNFDIAIARYNLDIADMDVLRTKAGGTIRGVSTGLVTGTPGGTAASTSTNSTTGSGSGGTSSGISGSASGSGGLVTSTQNAVGAPVDSYDPILSGTVKWDRATIPVSNTSTYKVSAYTQNTNQYSFSYTQAWTTGTLATVSFSNQRLANNIPQTGEVANNYTSFNPQLAGSWSASIRQHLLQGWGIENNNRRLIIARNDRKVTDASFRAQMIYTVAQIQNIYWDLVNAFEDLKVQQTAVQFAQRTLSDNKKQVETGTLAPIEVVSAQSSLAAATQKLIVSQTNLQLQQLITKNAISRNLTDPELTAALVIPTDTMYLSNEPLPPVEEMVNYALANRPELIQREYNLRNYVLNNKAAKNALLPVLDLVGYYGSSGLSSNYGDAFSDLVNRNNADKGAYLSLSIPLRNRAAQADQIRSELEYRQNLLNFQQQKNQITIAVRNAAFALQQARAGVEAARAARDYAQQSLESEQKKYALGASTSYLVLQQQSNETQAASNYVAALSTYEKARVALDQVTATILDRNGISMEDATTGHVTHMPAIPGLQHNPTPEVINPNAVTAQPMTK